MVAGRCFRLLQLVLVLVLGQMLAWAQDGTPVYYLPQVADGGTWKTTVTLVNRSTSSEGYTLSFFKNGRVPWDIELAGAGKVSVINGVLAPYETVVFETTGTSAEVQQGYAILEQATGGTRIQGYAVFRQRVEGRPDYEAVVPFISSNQLFPSVLLPYDNLNGFVTAMALIHPGSSSDTIPVIIYDAFGNVLLNDFLELEAGAHQAFVIPDRWPQTAGRRGLIQFGAFMLRPGIPILGLRFNPSGPFTTVFPIQPELPAL